MAEEVHAEWHNYSDESCSCSCVCSACHSDQVSYVPQQCYNRQVSVDEEYVKIGADFSEDDETASLCDAAASKQREEASDSCSILTSSMVIMLGDFYSCRRAVGARASCFYACVRNIWLLAGDIVRIALEYRLLLCHHGLRLETRAMLAILA